jgi:hypothetical protein
VSTDDFSPDDKAWGDPFEIDTTVAHPARRYNYWLGGKDNFEADRRSGDAVIAAFPTVRTAAIEGRRFLRRLVTHLVEEAGIRQFLDIGTGIPSADNVHEVAQSIAPETRVVYVDNDPIVLAHARRLLAGSPSGATVYIQGDLRRPDMILQNPQLRNVLDFSRPIALVLIQVLHFLDDAQRPYDHVARLVGALPPGSYLAMCHSTADFMPTGITRDMDTTVKEESARSRDPFVFRDRAAFARFFEGLELIPPGIESISDWHYDGPPEERTSPVDTMSYGAVARIR